MYLKASAVHASDMARGDQGGAEADERPQVQERQWANVHPTQVSVVVMVVVVMVVVVVHVDIVMMTAC